jgi:hypothetical protein
MANVTDATERGIFQLPRPTWVQDKDVNECTECKAEFTTFNRKVRVEGAPRTRVPRPLTRAAGLGGAHGTAC